jgi:2-keto-3-deoxy-L-rhamnonate aldolase RhmA
MLRTPTRQKTKLYRYLEDGASGLMIPLVSTAEEAKELVQSVKFPPIGQRGLDGAGLDGDFYLQNLDAYPEEANRETFLVVQIETPEAVRNAGEIAAVEGVDGLFIGPGDLGLRIKRGPSGTPTMQQSIEMVAAAAKKHGKAWGQPVGSVEQMKQLHALGGRLLAHGSEWWGMVQMFERATALYDEGCGQE